MLHDVSNDFKTYPFAIVNQLQNIEEMESEKVDYIRELVAEPLQKRDGLDNDHAIPQLCDFSQATMKDQVVDRQLDIIMAL